MRRSAEGKLLDEFASGERLGDDLASWCAGQGPVLPSVEKLVSRLLSGEGDEPDPECRWAEPDRHGAALRSLVEDRALEQMQVLWAVQKRCDDLGFPRVDDEHLVQAMFRAMYKHDLAEAGAFDEWKEDESDENARGKMKAVIQTVDWFAWLEEEESGDEYEEEEEEEDE